ncbi:MAG TPA: STAS domain-containing protein [Solirubrobacter sp.]
MPAEDVRWNLSPRTADDGATIELAPTGELDLATTRRLADALNAAQSRSRDVTLDLRRLDFMDCSSLAVLVTARERARRCDGRFHILRGPPSVERLFTLTGIEQLL